MDDLSTLAILQPTDAEVVAAQHAAVLAANDARTRLRLATDNRARGLREPQPGDRMQIQPARGIRPGRARAGIYFPADAWTEVRVLGQDDERPAPNSVSWKAVDVHGAEQILADDSLTSRGTSASEAEAGELRAKNAELEQRTARLEAELRAARRGAGPDPGDGTSARLKAAAATRAKSEDDFGGRKG
jgi:hypothetical protein